MILQLKTVPDKILDSQSRDVTDDEFGSALDVRMSDMAETMYAFKGVGLAGVQVGDARRILVADIKYTKGFEYGQ